MGAARKTLSAVILAAAIIFAFLLAGTRIIGLQPYIVFSGSMEPALPVGSAVYDSAVSADELQAGDIITFKLGPNSLATHRIVRIEQSPEGPCFVTKGDANQQEDAKKVAASNLVGKVRFHIPFMGYLMQFAQSRAGKVLIAALAVFWIALSFWPNRTRRSSP